MDEPRGEEVPVEVLRLRVEGKGRLVRADEVHCPVRAAEGGREGVDVAVDVSAVVHIHSRQATPAVHRAGIGVRGVG